MRIKRLEIYGYGKWVDETFNLAKDIHLFYGMNEAGKSTLMSFIHSILFGFPTRNSTALRYEPRESSRYGGKIIAEDTRFGEVIIERIHGKVTGNVTVTLEDGTTGSDELLDTLLHGMTREFYQNIFSFSLTDIEDVHKLDKNQLSRYLLSIGAHGTEYYLEIGDQLRADADKIYRPSGRVLELNKQLAILEKQEKKLVALEKKNTSYLALIEQLNEENKAIERLEKKQTQKEEKLNDIIAFKKEWHVFEEINRLQAEVAKINLPPLKEDGQYLLEEYKREKSTLNNRLQEIQLAMNAAKNQLDDPEMLATYEENKEAITALEDKLPEMIEKLRDYEAILEAKNQLKRELLDLERKLHVMDQPMYPVPFTPQEREGVRGWTAQLRNNELTKQEITQQLQQNENELALKHQKLDQIEAIMWDNEEFKTVEEDLREPPVNKKKSRFVPMLILVIVALLVIAYYFPSPINWLVGIVGVFASILFFMLSQRKPEKAPNALLEKEYNKQVTLKNDWQTALSEVDAIQASYQQLMQKQNMLARDRIGIQNSWKQLLEEHHLPARFTLEEAPFLFEQVAALHAAIQEEERQTERQNELRHQLEKETVVISTVLPLEAGITFKEKIARFRSYVSQVKAETTRQQGQLDQLTAFKQEEQQTKNQLENTNSKIATLFETTDVEDEEAFIARYQEKEHFDAKQNRLRFLKENSPNYKTYQVLPSREELEHQEASFHKELDELKADKNKALREMTNTQVMIENLEEDGTYSEELQVFENQKATAQRLTDEWVSNKVATWLIQDTLNQVTQDRFKEIISNAETFFSLLTDGEYERIVFKDDALFVQMRNGQVVDVRALSRGTAEPLYVAIRFAYIKNTMDILELPVIMDDPFVNFDETRRHYTYKLLQHLSEELQIIYFTFDPLVWNTFSEEQISDLEMRK